RRARARMRPGQGACGPDQAHRQGPGGARPGHAGRPGSRARLTQGGLRPAVPGGGPKPTLRATYLPQKGMTMSKILQGEIALVTGASRGIGAAIADELASMGATVIGTATSENGAGAIGERLAANGGHGR